MAQHLIYLGSNNASGEGMRHFFKIPLDPAFKAIASDVPTHLGGTGHPSAPVNYLPVYLSTGTNTGRVCTVMPCVIPFIGVMTTIQNQRIHDTMTPTIQAPIIKMDFLQGFRLEQEPHMTLLKQFYDPYNHEFDIELRDLVDRFLPQTSWLTRDLAFRELESYRSKVGSPEILRRIKNYIAPIQEYINNEPLTEYHDLTFLNPAIANDNALGINLSIIRSYYTYCEAKQSYPGTAMFRSSPCDNSQLNCQIRAIQEREPDKYMNIMNSPIMDVVAEIIQLRSWQDSDSILSFDDLWIYEHDSILSKPLPPLSPLRDAILRDCKAFPDALEGAGPEEKTKLPFADLRRSLPTSPSRFSRMRDPPVFKRTHKSASRYMGRSPEISPRRRRRVKSSRKSTRKSRRKITRKSSRRSTRKSRRKITRKSSRKSTRKARRRKPGVRKSRSKRQSRRVI